MPLLLVLPYGPERTQTANLSFAVGDGRRDLGQHDDGLVVEIAIALVIVKVVREVTALSGLADDQAEASKESGPGDHVPEQSLVVWAILEEELIAACHIEVGGRRVKNANAESVGFVLESDDRSVIRRVDPPQRARAAADDDGCFELQEEGGEML